MFHVAALSAPWGVKCLCIINKCINKKKNEHVCSGFAAKLLNYYFIIKKIQEGIFVYMFTVKRKVKITKKVQ